MSLKKCLCVCMHVCTHACVYVMCVCNVCMYVLTMFDYVYVVCMSGLTIYT